MNESSKQGRNRVVCIAGGVGFPYGLAATKRIVMMGRTFVEAEIPFDFWHIGPSIYERNADSRGKIDAIEFEYLPHISFLRCRALRRLAVLSGCVMLSARLAASRKNIVVYMFGTGVLAFQVLVLCAVLGIPVIQEVNEWWPDTDSETYLTRFTYKHLLFRLSSGAMPISQVIEDRIRSQVGVAYPMCRIPVLIDPMEYQDQRMNMDVLADPPTLFWCGGVDGYIRDVFFLIDVLGNLNSESGKKTNLILCGPYTEKTRMEIIERCHRNNLNSSRVKLLGFVSDDDLWKECKRATALMLPLWEDDRSNTRFPTKMAQYVAAERPIITVGLGEIASICTGDVTALFYAAGNIISCAACVDRLLIDPELGITLATRATKDILPHFNYRTHSPRVRALFDSIALSTQV